MARVAGRYGGYYGVHLGSEGYEIDEELQKALYVGREAALLDPGGGIPAALVRLEVATHLTWREHRGLIAQVRRQALEPEFRVLADVGVGRDLKPPFISTTKTTFVSSNPKHVVHQISTSFMVGPAPLSGLLQIVVRSLPRA